MRLKKGFTLAEILIVLMVIGALATMTIPSLMKGVQEAQWKTAYKKAFNNIANIMATERTASGLPATYSAANSAYMYDKLNEYLSIKSYLLTSNSAVNSGSAVARDKFTNIKPTGVPSGTSNNYWMVADDGLSYTIIPGSCTGTTSCTKQDINNQTSPSLAIARSTFVVVVDINGLSSLPNNAVMGNVSVSNTSSTPNLTGDQLYIYIGSDGATSGSQTNTLTGRITGGIK